MFTSLNLFHRYFSTTEFLRVPEGERDTVLAAMLWLGCKVADEPRQLCDVLHAAGLHSSISAPKALDVERRVIEALGFDALDASCCCHSTGAFLERVCECLCAQSLEDLRKLEAFSLCCCSLLSDCLLFPFSVEADPTLLTYAIVFLAFAVADYYDDDESGSGSSNCSEGNDHSTSHRLFATSNDLAFYRVNFREFLERRMSGLDGVFVVMAKVVWYLGEFVRPGFASNLPSLGKYNLDMYLSRDPDIRSLRASKGVCEEK